MQSTAPLVAALMAAVALAGCTGDTTPSDLAVASYPAAYAAQALAGDDLTILYLSAGSDLHHFEPSVRDLDQLRLSDHLILWNEELEAWAHQAEHSLGRNGPAFYEASLLPPGDVPLAGGPDPSGHGHDDHGDGADPHTWTDPLAMQASLQGLADYLQDAYPALAANITTRMHAELDRLDALDAAFQSGLAACDRSLVITNHAAHAYLARRYGFDLMTLHGLEPGSQPSPATIRNVIDAIEEHDIRLIFVEEGTDPSALASIRDETGVSIGRLHTLETRPAVGDYVTAQEANLHALRSALGCQ